MNALKRRAACFILSVGVAGACAASALDPTPAEVAAAKSAMQETAAWLLEEHVDSSGSALPNGARRSVTLNQAGFNADPTSASSDYAAFNNHAACRSLEYLALYAQHGADASVLGPDGHTERYHVRVGVRRLVDLILSLRSDDESKIFYGGIRKDFSTRTYSTLPNAACGHALLTASVAMNEPSWKQRAIEIGGFLLRLQNPTPYYAGRVDLSTRSTLDGIFDGVYSRSVTHGAGTVTYDDALYANMSTWNLDAAPFLEEIYAQTGVIGYHYGAIKIVRGLAFGALNRYDYYSVGGLPSSDLINSKFNNPYGSDCDYAYADGQWHHQGDPCPRGENNAYATTGTDGTEYGLAALRNYGYDSAALTSAYASLAAMPVRDSNGTPVSGYDMRLSFFGYFRECLPGFLCQPYHMGTDYDAVGLGLLARFKRDLAPGDIDGVFTALLKGPLNIGTAADSAFDAVWNPRSTYPRRRTQGVLPVATNATAVLKIVYAL